MADTQGFTIHTGIACPLDKANVDTDQLIPKQFLTGVTRAGYGRHLFHDWRYLNGDTHQPNPDFVLNQPVFAQASILLARENFGCGSSREHAPWALTDYGFCVIIGSSFADIFYNNCINNQLLPVTLPKAKLDALFKLVNQHPSVQLTVNLPAQTVKGADITLDFEISSQAKSSLLKGLDAIGQTLEKEANITQFESRLPNWC